MTIFKSSTHIVSQPPATLLTNGLIHLHSPLLMTVCHGGLPWSKLTISWHVCLWISSLPQVCFKCPYHVFALINISCTATSTDVERAFSRGGLTVSKMRHSLSDESTWAATVLSSWCDFPSAIPREEIIATFRDKSKRPKGRGKESVNAGEVPDVTMDYSD